jgi:hypothetical protein
MRKLGILQWAAALVALEIGLSAGCIGSEDQTAPGSDGAAGAEAGVACSTPTNGTCSGYPQSGCAPNETCMPGPPDQCCPAGKTQENGPCGDDVTFTGVWHANCAPGLVCIGGTCRKFCQSPADCASGYCVGFGPPPTPAYSVCTIPQPCDLLSPWKGCPLGMTCLPVGESGGATVTDCSGAGQGVGAGACVASPLDCKPGFVCVNGSCQQWCRALPAGFSDCPAPTTCNNLIEYSGSPVVIDGASYGSCK